MSIRLLRLPLLLALGLSSLALHAQQTEGLQQRMSAEEFKAAGLDKLSPQEMQTLDAWLVAHPKVTTRMVSPGGKPVFYANDSKPKAFEAHLVGYFDGWHGNHQAMTLDNGQVWQQMGSESPACMRADKPKVKVKPSLMGNWLMVVSGCNDSVHVERTH